MRRSASEIIRNLERRVARLEGKTASSDYDREVFLEYAGGFIKATSKLIKEAANVNHLIGETILVELYLDSARAVVSVLGGDYRTQTRRFNAQNLALGVTTHGTHNPRLLASLLEKEIKLGLPRGLNVKIVVPSLY